MKTIFKNIIFFICLFAFVLEGSTQSQPDVDFALDNIEHIEGTKVVRLYFKALNKEDNSPINIRHSGLEVTEIINGNIKRLDVYPNHVHDSLIIKKDDTQVEPFNATFLLDVGGKMSKKDIEEAKDLIKSVVKKHGVSSNKSTFKLITFDNQLNESQDLNAKNLTSTLNKIKQKGDGSDFYDALIHTIRDLKREKNKSILFILSNGFNDISENPEYKFRIPYNEEDVMNQIDALGINSYIFPIIFSKDEHKSLLEKIVDKSDAEDTFQRGVLPEKLKDIIKNNEVVKSTSYVDVYTSKVFRGEDRTYTLEWNAIKNEIPFSKGSATNDSQEIELAQFGLYFFIGLLIIGAIVGLCSFIVPLLRNRHFIQNFVKPYVPESNRRRNDPITNEPIQAGELVVHKCQQLTPLTTWEGLGGQCPNYPDCMDFNVPCKGQGAPMGNDNFFSMQGAYRRLNWMWYGATGGFIAWTLLYLFKLLDFEWYENIISSFFTESIINSDSTISNSALKNQLDNLSNDTLAGAMFGLGLIFMLSLVEEKSQPRQISWGRIILRTMLGMVVSLFVFLAGFMLQFYDFVPNGYVAGLITWSLLGVAIGLILSIKSSIAVARGVLGGFVSILIAYHAYLLLGAFTSDYILGKLLSLILLGGLLGWILETVVTRLEDFELEYISPETFRNVVPISKWLKAGIDIFIGTDSGSYIYVKWDDGAVQPQHAKLIYDNGVVFIEPLAETLVKGRILSYNRKTALKNGDVIQLGRDSITRMRYREKGRTIVSDNTNGMPPPPPPPVDDGKPKIRINR